MLYECEQCNAVNRVAGFRLDKQPVCGACGREIEDFPFCRQVRRAWKHKNAIIFIASIAGLAAAIGLDRLHGGAGTEAASTRNAAPAALAGPKARAYNLPEGYEFVEQTPPAAPLPFAPQSPPPAAVFQPNGVLYVDPKAKDRERVAPFSISTPSSGGGFYVKLVYRGTTCSYLKLFVNAGTRFETQLALGKYDILYATGERWLGRREARQAEPCPPPKPSTRLCRDTRRRIARRKVSRFSGRLSCASDWILHSPSIRAKMKCRSITLATISNSLTRGTVT